MMPQAGGQYVYLREAYNPAFGFLYGWTLFLVIQTGTIAAVAIAFARFAGVIIPWFSPTHWIWQIGTFGPYQMPFGTMGPYHVGLHTQNFLAIISVIILTWINTRGIQEGKIVQNLFTFTKTAALLGLILLGIFIGKNATAIGMNFKDFWKPMSITPSGLVELSGLALWTVVGTSMVGSLFSSDAWNNITFTAGEVIHPKKDIPLSLVLGTGTVILLYFLANVGYIMTLPLQGDPNGATAIARGIQFAADDRVGTAATEVIFGTGATIIMAVFIMISTFGCANGLILSGARVYYAMAKDGLFFEKVGKLNRKSVPARGLVFQCIWASLLCLSGTYGDILDYVIFAVLIFYILTIAGIFILRKKQPNAERPYKAFGYPVIPALYILAALAISIDLLIYKPRYTWPGLIIVLLGLPVYYYWHGRKAKTV
jgi:APA family basic amino acid/polyamine antiporter